MCQSCRFFFIYIYLNPKQNIKRPLAVLISTPSHIHLYKREVDVFLPRERPHKFVNLGMNLKLLNKEILVDMKYNWVSF